MTATATTSSLPANPNPPDFEADDDNASELDGGGGVIDDDETGESEHAPEGFQTPTGGNGHSAQAQPDMDPPRRRRRTRAQIEADAAAAQPAQTGVFGAGAAAAPATNLVPTAPARRARTVHPQDPSPEELQALGWLVVQARKQGIAPEEFVANLRLAIAAWDSTQ